MHFISGGFGGGGGITTYFYSKSSRGSHNGSILASIMHIDLIEMLKWQLIKEERGD
jgi:hypothetical protein